MGIIIIMKFVALLLVAAVSAKKLPYDLDVPTMDAAIADAAHKNRLNNGASDAHDAATAATNAATAAHSSAAAASGASAGARGDAKTAFDGTDYHNGAAYAGAEATHKASVAANEAAVDAKNKAQDQMVHDQIVEERANRDHAAATAAKNAADANEAANRARVAYEKDQFIRGQNQDRNKELGENDRAEMSRIQDKHDQREAANARLKKALA